MKLNVILLSLLLSLAISPLFSQIPTVTGIQPEAGPIGTSVTITGTGFGSNSSDLEVFFGTIRAGITAVAPETIIVTVPTGTAYDAPIVRVKSTGRMVYSPKPFITTFNSSGEIAASSFLPRVDLSVGTGSKPNNLVAGDVDGDGNVDLITANAGTSSISVFRNVRSDTGPVTTSTFSVPVVYTAGAIWAIALADLDGDGKPEVIGTNPSLGKVIIFQNVSTPGIVSFQPKVELPTDGGSAYGIAIGDLNGDARAEIVVTSKYYGRVSVYRNNIPNPGTITAGSFSTRVEFAAGTDAMDVTLGDIDGDGWRDIVVAYKGIGAGLSVLRNLGSTSISAASFAPKVEFYAGTEPTSVLLTDVDRDGKPDVVTSNTGSYTLALNRNLSTPGTILATSFAPRQEFSTGWQPMKVAVADFDGDGFPDAATANNYTTNNVAVFENSNVPASPLTNSFFPRLNLLASGTASGIVAADFNGDGLPDLATSNISTATISIFVNNNIRTTPPAVITALSPNNGNFGDEVTITGRNFSRRPTNNFIKFNGLVATVISSTDTTLKVYVPSFATTGKISLCVNGLETTTSASDFIVFQVPSITGFAPISGPIGTVVTIEGTNFSAVPSENIVFFGATRALVTSASVNKLNVVVPFGATYEVVSVSVHAMVVYTHKPFTVTFPGGPLSTAMFSNKVVLSSGIKFASDVAVGDLNGDGKSDLLMGGETGGVSVFRNTSAGGAITNTTFASRTMVPGTASTRIARLELEDMDFDGKLDLILGSETVIQFFRNTSGSTTISFASPVTIQTAGGARMAIADMDLDGKPDLVYGTSYNQNFVFVARNTSIRGQALSFATAATFVTSSNCFDIAVADIDSDGKVDIIFPNASNKFSVSILRNKSTPTTIDANSFAAPVDFTVPSAPEAVAAADFDGDGKIDLAASCYGFSGLNVLSALQNTSTPGYISSTSFAPAAVWKMSSSSYATRTADLDGDGKPEIALPICGYSSCVITALRNISAPGLPFLSSFEARKDLGVIGHQTILEVADLNGDGRPELISTQSSAGDIYDLAIFENKSTNPYATSFTPANGPVGTVVTITGYNFNITPGLNQVTFNLAPAQVISATANSLTVIVPEAATTGPISMTANGLTSDTTTPFTVTRVAQNILFSTLSPVFIDHGTLTLTATASSGLTVEFISSDPGVATVEGNIITIEGVGTTTITALQAGNTYYASAEPVSWDLTVNKIPQTTTFAALIPVRIDEGQIQLNASTSSGLAVEFTSSNEEVATVTGDKVALVGAGKTIITAVQSGNAYFAPAEPVSWELTVNKMQQTITFTALPPVLMNEGPIALDAVTSSGLAVEFTSSDEDVATVTGNRVTLIGAGNTIITAVQPGNTNFEAAEPVSWELNVNRVAQTITFAIIPEKTIGEGVVVLEATASSGLPVTFESSDRTVAIVTDNEVEMIAPGNTTITATQPGNVMFLIATPVMQTLVVKVVTNVDPNAVRDDLISPNPVSSWAKISINDAGINSQKNARIYDASGRLVVRHSFDQGEETTLDLTSLPNGIYLLQLQMKTATYTARFAVIH